MCSWCLNPQPAPQGAALGAENHGHALPRCCPAPALGIGAVPRVRGRRMSVSQEFGLCLESVAKSTCPRRSRFCEHLVAGLGTVLIYKGFCALGSGAHYLENYLYEEIH